MKNIKLYLQIGGVIIIIILAGLYSRERKLKLFERSEKERVQDNQENLMADNQNLVVLNLQVSELTGKYKRERDSIAELNKLKPKQIIKYVDREVYRIDSVPKYIPLERPNDSTYLLKDGDDCFKYEAMIVLENDSMRFVRLLHEEANTLVESYYWYRKWFLGKKQYTQVANAKCGGVKTTEINIIKKEKP
jgi:hypothetical protein